MKVKGWENSCHIHIGTHIHTRQKKLSIAILTLHKTDLKANKKWALEFMLTKVQNITNLNYETFHNKGSKEIKQNLIEKEITTPQQ